MKGNWLQLARQKPLMSSCMNTLCRGSHLSPSFKDLVRRVGGLRYLGSFPQKLGQSDHVGFKLSLVGPLTSHFQS